MLSITTFRMLLFISICLKSQSSIALELSKILYDDSYITDNLNDRYPYLKLSNGSYIPPRDYFNFTNIFQPTESYLQQVNIEEHLYDELRAMEFSNSIATMDQWHYSDESELLESGQPDANKLKCASDLEYISKQLNWSDNNNSSDYLFTRGLANIQLLRYMDSWGRPPSETYHGHSYWVGSYRACKLASLQGANDKMKFGYCWGKLRAKSWPNSDEMIPPTSFRVGLCLPKSCDTKLANYNNRTIHQIMLFNFSPLQRERFDQFIDIYCLPNRNNDGLPLKGKIFLLIVGSWIFFLLGISLLLAIGTNKFLPKSLIGITIQSSYRKLVANDPPPSSSPSPVGFQCVDLRSLGVIRLFGSIGVCLAHTGCAFGWVFNSSTFSLIEYRKLAYHIMPSLLKSLDLFMVIGGLLTGFTIASKFPAHRIKSIIRPKVYLGLLLIRYLRLAPMVMLVVYFMKALYPSLSEGPMWDYGTDKFSMQGQCQRSSWWRVLVFPILFGYKGNYYTHECLPASWYLITDLKISFVAPILVYLVHRLRANYNKWLVVISSVLLSTLWQYHGLSEQKIIYFQQFFTYGQLYGVNILNLNFGETGYFNAINRLYAVSIGLFAGFYLHKYKHQQQERGDRQARWPGWMTGYCFWALIGWQIYDFFAPHMAQYNYQHYGHIPSEETIKLAMLIKPRLDAIMFAIISLRLTSDLAPWLMQNTLPLYKLGKLSYCVYLIHSIIISYALSSHELSRPNYVFLQFIMLATFVISMSFIISFPLHLLFEAPLAQILSHFMPKTRPRVAGGQQRKLQGIEASGKLCGATKSD